MNVGVLSKTQGGKSSNHDKGQRAFQHGDLSGGIPWRRGSIGRGPRGVKSRVVIGVPRSVSGRAFTRTASNSKYLRLQPLGLWVSLVCIGERIVSPEKREVVPPYDAYIPELIRATSSPISREKYHGESCPTSSARCAGACGFRPAATWSASGSAGSRCPPGAGLRPQV